MRQALLLVAVVAELGVGEIRAAHAQVVDPKWQATQVAMKADEQRQCRHMTLTRKFQCQEQLQETYKAKGLVPGTMPYVRRRFGGESVQALDQEIRSINRTYGQVRRLNGYEHPLPGELTADMQQGNVSYLSKLIEEKGGMPSLLPFGSR
ncbi:hypothetical protein ACQW08_04395 [Gluconobacter japonicus]|uniref:hypothetical protein n=1 Tax=Gluconobacter japonicus TaxID=376620 RepID=UPI003D2BA336